MYEKDLIGSSREEISVLYAEKEHVRSGNMYGPVIRSTYIIECCTGGSGSVIINGTEFPVSAGVCYALLPGNAVAHTSNINDPRQGYWCALDGLAVGMCLKQAGITSEAPFISSVLFDNVCNWLRMLTESWACQDAGSQLRQTACAYGLLGAILLDKPAVEKTTLIDKAIGYIQTNYPDPLNVDSIATQVGLERSYFSARFKEKTGLSPHQYLTKVRIQKARQLLDNTQYSVSEVSYMVGLEPHNFSRLFKKEIGITALDYHRKKKSGKQLLSVKTKSIK